LCASCILAQIRRLRHPRLYPRPEGRGFTRKADKRSERDALIAATAFVHGMTVVTRNVADFNPTGVTLINPWEELH
jgi:predicted nucleic acid-binding protein